MVHHRPRKSRSFQGEKSLFLHLIALAAVAASADGINARYALGATVGPDRGLVAVDAIVALPSASAGTTTEFVIGRSYEIESADAGPGASVLVEDSEKPWPGLQRVLVKFDEAASAPTLRMRYSGPLNPSGNPPLNMITPELVEMNLDSMWIPIRSDLGGRFTVDARIAGLPADAVVVSQGEVTASDGEVRIRRSIADLDFAFAAVPNLQRTALADFELYARDPQSERSQLYLKHGPSAVSFLERWLGPMPGKPARLVIVPRPRVSGYARKGYIVVTEGAKSSEAGIAKFTAHEFAHLWFSNANATTEHRWLDESIAEYASLRYVEQALGRAAVEEMLAEKREAAAGAKAVQGLSRGDAELYGKGALLLVDLEQRLGRAKMDQLLAEVARRKIGTTPEFLALLQKAAGEGIRNWFAEELTRG